MKNEIDALIDAIAEDYKIFAMGSGRRELSDYSLGVYNSIKDRSVVKITQGKKYIRVSIQDSVWGFIVCDENDDKFQVGDVLKAKSWATPVRNASRGNIFNDIRDWRWTGADYMR